jgi:hypothetical protein
MCDYISFLLCLTQHNKYCGNSNLTVSYRPVLSSGRALQNNKAAAVYGKSHGEGKIGQGSQMGT